MIISFISFKGGVGKSTLAQNIAVALVVQGKSVALLDTDPTYSTLSWSQARDEKDLQCFHHDNSRTVTSAIRKLRSKFDFVIVDCPPAINPITTRILLIADLNLIPILPSGSDTWTTERFLEHIETARSKANFEIPARLVINRFSPRLLFHQEFLSALQKYAELYQIPICETKIKSRTVFQAANADGCAVVEYDDFKASSEIHNLLNEILS